MIGRTRAAGALAWVAALLFSAHEHGQFIPAPPLDAKPEPRPADPTLTGALAPFAWLEGCWRGDVNRRDFREHWLPLRGDLLVGASHTVMEGKTLSYEYL